MTCTVPPSRSRAACTDSGEVTNDLRHGPVCDPLAVGETPPAHSPGALAEQRDELGREARLAHARFSHDSHQAAAAHGEHEKRTGMRDENWPAWYAEHMMKEQSGEKLPE